MSGHVQQENTGETSGGEEEQDALKRQIELFREIFLTLVKFPSNTYNTRSN